MKFIFLLYQNPFSISFMQSIYTYGEWLDLLFVRFYHEVNITPYDDIGEHHHRSLWVCIRVNVWLVVFR